MAVINDGFIEFSLLVALCPDLPSSNSGNVPRTITRFLKFSFDTAIPTSEVYKRIQDEYCIRTDIFDSIVLYHRSKWSRRRMEYVHSRYPNVPIPGFQSQQNTAPTPTIEQNTAPTPTPTIEQNTAPTPTIENRSCYYANDQRPQPRFKRAFTQSGLTQEEFFQGFFKAVQDPTFMHLTPKGFTDAFLSFRLLLLKRKSENLVFKCVFDGLFPDYNDTNIQTRLYMELSCGTAASAILAIRQMLTLDGTMITMLPSREKMQEWTRKIQKDFIRIFNPKRTPTGFRCDLVLVVRFLLMVLHGITDLNGVQIDIYGDAMTKGKKNVTRLLVRILTAVNQYSKAQSSSYMFCFTAFRGKDSRANLEANLGSFTELGARGWLFEQTEILRKAGGQLTVTGDATFNMHLTTSLLCDNTLSPSKLEMYITEVSPIKLIELEERLRLKHEAKLKLTTTAATAEESKKKKETPRRKFIARRDCPEDYQQGLKDLDAILPGSVHITTHRRTDLEITLNTELPSASLVSLDSILCVCPDPLHQMVRIVEVMIHRVAQHLLNNGNGSQLETLADNITLLGVKNNPRFTFEVTTQASGGKKVARPSFSGSDALVILADEQDLVDCSTYVRPLFSGVFLPGTQKVPVTSNLHSTGVLENLCPKFVHTANSENISVKFFYYRDLAEINFSALNECFTLLRSRAPWDNAKITKYKEAVDVFYASTDVLFTGEADCDLTPYMLKLDLMWRLMEPRKDEQGNTLPAYIKHIWNHLGEGGEKSHHIATGIYHNKTMRDGGIADRHHVSEFIDIRQSYVSIARIAMEATPEDEPDPIVRSYDQLIRVCRESVNTEVENKRTYLDITREPIGAPVFVAGVKTKGEQLRGLVFAALGGFPGEKVEFNGSSMETLTQLTLRKMIVSMGGTWYGALQKVVSNPLLISSYYCVVANQTTLTNLATKIGSKLEPNKGLDECVKGPWKFIKVKFILDCYKILPDPITRACEVPHPNTYLLTMTTTKIILKRQFCAISKLLSNQEKSVPGVCLKSVSALSALKRNKREPKEKPKRNNEKKTRKKRNIRRTSVTTTAQPSVTTTAQPSVTTTARLTAYNNFRKEFSRKANERIKEQRIELASSRSSSGATLPTKAKEIKCIAELLPLIKTTALNRMASNEWREKNTQQRASYLL